MTPSLHGFESDASGSAEGEWNEEQRQHQSGKQDMDPPNSGHRINPLFFDPGLAIRLRL